VIEDRSREAQANIEARFVRALTRAGLELVGGLQMLVSVPVEYDAGGNVVRRSMPGEPPRMETGRLQAGFDSQVTTGENVLLLRVSSDREGTPDVPGELELKMNRPFMSTSFEEAGNAVLDAIREEFA
jgi:hypothetical protein